MRRDPVRATILVLILFAFAVVCLVVGIRAVQP
jgi:hypothetical protein